MLNKIFLCIVFFSLSNSWSKSVELKNLKKESVNIINAKDYDLAGGDTLFLMADSIAGLRFIDFKGDSLKPLVIINKGGQVLINESIYHGLHFQNSHFIHVSGAGDKNHKYGIWVQQASPEKGGLGVAVGSLSSDFEINNIHIQNTGFAGIMAKTDPNCNDTLTWRKNGFVLKNLKIHDNYIHHTHGEGMYIGYTGGYKITSKVSCNGELVFGHWLENVRVENNLLEQTGWDGIQLNLIRKNGVVKNNIILEYGTAQEYAQNFGMSIGSGVYDIINNYVRNGKDTIGVGAMGMQLINGESGTRIIGNTFIRSGSYGIFIHNRYAFDDVKNGYVVAHNTIIEPTNSGIFYNATITTAENSLDVGKTQIEVPYHLINNLVVNPLVDYSSSNFWKKERESFYDFITPELRNAQEAYSKSNVYTRQIDSIQFKDIKGGDYGLTKNSPIIDEGFNAAAFFIPNDSRGIIRGKDGYYDIGANEYSDEIIATLNFIKASNSEVLWLNQNDFKNFQSENSDLTWIYFSSTGQRFNLPNDEFQSKSKIIWALAYGTEGLIYRIKIRAD